MDRNLIDEEKDWDKMFPVHAIYPGAVDSAKFLELRSRLIGRIIKRKIVRNPYEAAKILRRLFRCMSIGDVYRLLAYSRNNSGGEQVVG